jgi:hypothetical protein
MCDRKMIYLDDAINALKAMALPLSKDPGCEDIWERDRTLDNAIVVMRGLPSAQPEATISLKSCSGCKWEHEHFSVECNMCSRISTDNYQRRKNDG